MLNDRIRFRDLVASIRSYCR